MFWRVVRFYFFLGAGSLLGYLLWPASPGWWIELAGAMVGGSIWLLLDLRRGASLLGWLRDPHGQPVPALSGVWGNVASRAQTLLKNGSRALEQSETRLTDFLAAIQNSPNGVVLLDAAGRIEWCNHTACEHFGFDPTRDLQQAIGNLVRDPDFAAYHAAQDYVRAVVIAGPRSTASRPVRLAIDLHPYGEGRKLMLSRDVTALEQAEAMRRDFVANVSHEIRTPLTVLAGFIETLQSLPLSPDEQQRYLGMMAQQSQRMQLLVSDLLTLSRLEGSPAPGLDSWHSVSRLSDACEGEALGLSQSLSQAQHSISFSTPSGLELAGSQSELQSALSNLVSNAVRYTPGTGSITAVWIQDLAGGVEFSVTDTGPGIAPEHLSRITERFYRVDRSRARDTGGTGLGLAIVKHVVQRHGGQLRIQSSLGQGSRFAIYFPANRVRHAP
jgi:two-component system phosphate regulon sensor histidine kinase PhoR